MNINILILIYKTIIGESSWLSSGQDARMFCLIEILLTGLLIRFCQNRKAQIVALRSECVSSKKIKYCH